MKHVNLLIASVPEETIDTFAKRIFPLFGVMSYEERFSSHYVEERYFLGGNDEIEVKIMLSDDQDHSDLPFWIRLIARRNGMDLEDQFIEELVRKRLLPSGLRVARIDKFGQVGEKRFDY